MINIFSIILPLVITGVVLWFFLRTRRPRKPKAIKDDHRSRQERAVWGWARVVTATSGPVDAGSRVRVEMQLEVHTPGSQPYLATTTWLVEQDALAFLEEGKEISLKVDPLDMQYVYPNGPWAKIVE